MAIVRDSFRGPTFGAPLVQLGLLLLLSGCPGTVESPSQQDSAAKAQEPDAGAEPSTYDDAGSLSLDAGEDPSDIQDAGAPLGEQPLGDAAAYEGPEGDASSPPPPPPPPPPPVAALYDLGDVAPGRSARVQPWAMSQDGRVIVGSTVEGNRARAFRWTEATGVVLLFETEPATYGTRANAVSADGEIIAGLTLEANNASQAFRVVSGVLQPLGFLPGGADRGMSEAIAMSADGQWVVGNSASASTNVNGAEAFAWNAVTGMTAVGDLAEGFFFSGARTISNDGRVIGGWGNDASGTRAVRWLDGVPSALPNLGVTSNAYANAVSADGRVLAGYSQSGEKSWHTRPVRWLDGGAAEDLGALPGLPWGAATEISADGSTIVGVSYADGGARAAFVWTAGAGLRSLQELLESAGVSTAGHTLTELRAVSADGRIVAGFENDATYPSRARGFRALLPPH